MIKRQPARTQGSSPKTWYMLRVPPPVQQPGLTCWAAALESWLKVMGLGQQGVREFIWRYAGTACIDPDNALPYLTAEEVYAEWGIHFTNFGKENPITYDNLKSLLKNHGHLIMADTSSTLGHAVVVYGVGIDENGLPNRDYFSIMDPIDARHKNLSINVLEYPVEIGFVGQRERPAPCLSDPGKVPED